jgi:hypothetical protein
MNNKTIGAPAPLTMRVVSTSGANTERRREALKTLLELCRLTPTELARRARL